MNFTEKYHNWDEVLIEVKNKKITRDYIKKYYENNLSKLFRYLKNKDVIVILGISKNNFVLKRLISNKNIHITKKYGINDQHSIEYWINRRAIEFHPVIKSTTNHIWVDIDVHDGKKLDSHALAWARKIEKYFKSHYKAKTQIWDSGRNGYHIEGYLKKSVKTDIIRKHLKKWLAKIIMETNDLKSTIGIAKKGQIRLDLTTLKKTGSIRAPYSFTIEGKFKKPMSKIHQ